jgi:hypothetical protein
MTVTTSRPTLNVFMDAYEVLGVGSAASPLAIRRAYKRQLRHASRDRLSSIESAYRLVREAPLRHHRVSTGEEPDRPWTDDELQQAWRLAQLENAMSYVLGLTLGALALGLYAWLVLPHLWSWSYVAGPVIAIAMVGCLATFALSRVPSSVHLWRAIEVYRRLVGSN